MIESIPTIKCGCGRPVMFQIKDHAELHCEECLKDAALLMPGEFVQVRTLEEWERHLVGDGK